jgi:hypothetical protein
METKQYIRIFSWGFIAMLFLCVFFRIEAWPFSDFRVFRKLNKVEHINIYKLGFYNDDNEIIWALPPRKMKHIYSKLQFLLPRNKEKAREVLMQFVPRIRKSFGEKYKRLYLIQVRVQYDSNNDFKFVTTPFMRIKY